MSEENTNQLATRAEKYAAIRVDRDGLILATFDDVIRVAQMAKDSHIVQPDWNLADVTLVLLNALEIHLSPLQALQQSYIVNNRVSIFGDAPKSLVDSSGLLEDYKEAWSGKPYDDDFTAIVRVKRKGRTESVTEFSVANARTAGLWEKSAIRNGKETSPWKLYPERMLMARAKGYALKDNFPDVLRGSAIHELEDDGQGFDHAKPAKIVEPNFQNQAIRPPEKTDVAEPRTSDAIKRGPGRPRKVEPQPAAEASSTAPAAAPAEPEPKTAEPPQTAPKTAAAPEPANLSQEHVELVKRLNSEKLSRIGFLLRMLHYNCVGNATEGDIREGRYTIENLAPDDIDLALKNWQQVTAPLEKLSPV